MTGIVQNKGKLTARPPTRKPQAHTPPAPTREPSRQASKMAQAGSSSPPKLPRFEGFLRESITVRDYPLYPLFRKPEKGKPSSKQTLPSQAGPRAVDDAPQASAGLVAVAGRKKTQEEIDAEWVKFKNNATYNFVIRPLLGPDSAPDAKPTVDQMTDLGSAIKSIKRGEGDTPLVQDYERKVLDQLRTNFWGARDIGFGFDSVQKTLNEQAALAVNGLSLTQKGVETSRVDEENGLATLTIYGELTSRENPLMVLNYRTEVKPLSEFMKSNGGNLPLAESARKLALTQEADRIRDEIRGAYKTRMGQLIAIARKDAEAEMKKMGLANPK